MTGSDGGDGPADPDESASEPEVDTTDPRRTGSGFTFPAQQDDGPSGRTERDPDPENLVTDHPVARQSSGDSSR